VLLGIAACAVAVGCGLFSSNLLSYDFSLPSKSFTADASTMVPSAWSTAGLTTVPNVPCPTVDCCTIATAAGEQCATYSLTCVSGSCEADPEIVLVNEVNLSTEAPQLTAVASNVPSFAHVTLKRLYLSDYSNSLNWATPEIEIWMGPDTAATVHDTDASGTPVCSLLGTLPSIPANTSCPAGACSGLDVQLTADGAATFESFALNFRQTFKFFARMTVKVKAGDPVPTGTFQGTVTGEATASL
jgi:hypothetical protein